MSTMVKTRSAWARDQGVIPPALAGAPRPSWPGGADREPTLADVIARVWEELTVGASVGCPLCGAEMEPEYAADSRPVSGRCHSCGTAIA